jgi:hypothetical protein
MVLVMLAASRPPLHCDAIAFSGEVVFRFAGVKRNKAKLMYEKKRG